MSIKYKQKEVRSRKQCWSETLSKPRYYWQHLNILLCCLLLPKWLSITYYCTRTFFYLCNCSWYCAYTIMPISMWITLFIFSYSYKCFWRSDKKIGGSRNGTSRTRGPSFMWLWSRKSSVIPGNKFFEYLLWIIQLRFITLYVWESRIIKISFFKQVKWYKGTHEFYRYSPREEAKLFLVENLDVDVSVY